MQIKNLKTALSNVSINTIGHVTTMTSQKSKVSKKAAKKMGIDPDSVMKYSEIQVQFGSSYKTRVNNQRSRENKESDFIPETAFYKMVSGALAINKKDNSKFYAIVTPQKNTKGNSYYLINGKKVNFSLIQKLFNPSALKKYKTRQNVKSEIKHLVIGLNSITRCALNGKVVL